ncbi:MULTISPECIES: hypothetical protein [Listeria]|uniref:hypothetical protein n=1 Tax=Listeria TaxID=1637 RepID=UPI000512896C|nr:hypothetical protein [Listeria ivanovii]AIS61328.1 hypothetical protein JL53_00600 [Listeria ivanovii subsp. londoniensis]MBK1995859.1 hypothetical protein [Listeria ivanovii subsp. londoniensis]HAA3128504.1 hypothetical protein [Listeria monocytogenes]HEO8496483.1 hypothetical protein [Listeria monocytogenes]
MKKGIGILLLGLVLLLGACGTDSADKEPKETKETKKTTESKKQEVTAESTMDSFVKAEIAMYKNVVFTEDTDPNELLGRPNSYIAKIDFNDKTAIDRIATKNINDLGLDESDKGAQIEQLINERTGGTIEEFKTEEDLQKRLEYLQDLPVKTDVDNEYRFSNSKVLLRIDSKLTPNEAEKYKKVFLNL